jgi:hypothetical protein
MNRLQRRTLSSTFALAIALAATAPAPAAILEDFQFNDANGTAITGAVNSANAGNNWLSQNTAINAGVQSGSFRIQKGSEATPVTGQVGNTLSIANVANGKVWLVADIAGWLYAETPSSPSERVRFAFLDNDPPAAGSSTITAQMNVDRLASGNLTITGDAGGMNATAAIAGGPDLSRTRNAPLTLVLEVDADADKYTIYYKDGAAAFATLGTGNLGERSAGVMREARSARFAFTGTYSEAGEFVDVDRIYVTTTNPIPEPAGAALIGVAAACLTRTRGRVRAASA